MTAQDFVERLERSGPTLRALEGQGLSRAEAEDFILSFRPPKRSPPSLTDAGLGEVGQLLTGYDCSHVEIGMVRLRSDPVWNGRSWIIAQVEADPVVVDASTMEIRVEELGAEHHVLWRCAKDGESFLGALAAAADLLGRMAVDDSLQDDDMFLSKTLSACTSAAGGSQYEPFYRMLLGIA